jgi:hypothetical protein
LYETLLSGWETKIQIIRRMTFLAIDIGNTRLKWAMYDDHRPGAALLAHGAEFLEHIERLAEGLGRLPAPTRMLGCVVAGDTAKRRVHEQIELMLGWTWSRSGWCRRWRKPAWSMATTILRAWGPTAGWP